MSTKTLLNPFFGEYGGMYVPQILVPALLQLEEAFVKYKDDPTFKQELNDLLYNYAGRPTPLTLCRNITNTCLSLSKNFIHPCLQLRHIVEQRNKVNTRRIRKPYIISP